MSGTGKSAVERGWARFRDGLSLLVLSASFGVIAPVFAQPPEESILLGERPSVNGEATEVRLGVLVMDIDEIDDVNQRFSIDLFIVARWHDPRLALPEDERRGQSRYMAQDEVWTPRLLFLNDRGLEAQLRQGVVVNDEGGVKYQNRLSGELAANLEFREFPFDVQRLPLDLVSYEYGIDELRFSLESLIVSEPDRFSIEGWRLKLLEPEIGVFRPPVGDGLELPRLSYIIEADRESRYYVLTMLVPMSLIIFMAWTVFWLQPNIVPPRIAISTASIFSLIALGVSIRLGLPKISYLTRADIFVMGCTLLVFIALGLAVIGSRWASSERMERALQANFYARWIYLVLFAVVALAAFL